MSRFIASITTHVVIVATTALFNHARLNKPSWRNEMYSVVRVKRTGHILWISQYGTYNSNLCEFICYSETKGEM